MPDYLRPAISRELAPVLKQAGFTRCKPAHFLRADGDILHSITLLRSRYGSGDLMLAYRFGLLCDPLLDTGSQPAGLGDIIQHHDWRTATETDARQSLAAICDYCTTHVLPWLAAHDSVTAYLAAQRNPRQRDNAADLACNIARLLDGGDPAAVRDDCARLAAPANYWQPEAHEHAIMRHARALAAAINAADWQPLLAQWAAANRSRCKLPA